MGQYGGRSPCLVNDNKTHCKCVSEFDVANNNLKETNGAMVPCIGLQGYHHSSSRVSAFEKPYVKCYLSALGYYFFLN